MPKRVGTTCGWNETSAMPRKSVRSSPGVRGFFSPCASVLAVARENGLPGEELLKEETSPAVQALYKNYSEEAERLGVFGAPTYVLDGERFWGQDRLEFLERALGAMK